MNTLFAKLSLALLGIVVVTGGLFFLLERYTTRNYYEEITQRLNSSIAMYVTGERQLIENGVVNEDALSLLASQAMVINPTVEIYLLDPAGGILGHALPPESVLTDSVDLGPVRQLIEGRAKMPLRGTDPRNRDREKIFSAHPVMHDGRLQGYLYAILGGQKYDELADSVRGSYVQQISFGAMLTIVAAAFLVGLLVFGLMTRRLSRLTGQVRRFAESGFDPAGFDPAGFELSGGGRDTTGQKGSADEIGQLQLAFGRMTDKIREQFENLKETEKLRRELVANVSHDLRTPLASMHGYVETLLLKNDTLSEAERLHYLEITRKHTQRLGQLIEDLFQLSCLEANSIEPKLESFSLAELLQDVVQEFELQAQKRGITIEVPPVPGDSTVNADIGLLQRVLENLIRNAIKFTPAGGRVSIGLERKPDRVAVAVADTGRGIARDELPRVFDRFYQAGHGGEAASGSTGLGLAIVKKILELHGSRITVSSVVNQGTRFEFDLPAKLAA